MAHKNYYNAEEELGDEEASDNELENPTDEEDDFERADEFGDGGDGY